MGRRYQLLLAVIVTGLMTAGVAQAGIPDPSLCDVPTVLTVPGGGLAYTVEIRGSEGPIDTATVQLVFSDEADTLAAWCVGQVHPIIEATTDVDGLATFYIAAGGCLNPADVSTHVVEVFANGIKIAEVGMVSPDAVDAGGTKPTDGWNVPSGGTAEVGLSDGSFHTPAVKTGAYEFCTDFNGSGDVSLGDAGIMTPYVKAGSLCTVQ